MPVTPRKIVPIVLADLKAMGAVVGVVLAATVIGGCAGTPQEPGAVSASRLVAPAALTAGAAATPQVSRGQNEPVNVGFLVLDGVYNSELIAPYDIFHHTIFHDPVGMRVFTVGREQSTVTSFEGLRIGIDYDLETAPRIDVLVIPSAKHNMDSDLEDKRLLRWIEQRGASAGFLLSICDGAFLLAEAGLLDGRRCTTFPGDIPAFRARYPHLTVIEGVSFVADGRAITGVGGARSYDPALYLVERAYGARAARGVARGMVLDWDLEQVRHLDMSGADEFADQHADAGGETEGRTAGRTASYLPGERIDPGVRVEDAEGRPVRLADLVSERDDVRAVVLTIIAGAEANDSAKRGGLWCEDSAAEIAPLRHLQMQYASRGVLFVGVLCPPVYHEARFGYDEGSFLTRPDTDEVYRRNRRSFVEASRRMVDDGRLPFDVVVFDPRFRLLANPQRGVAAAATGPRPPWQGRFKWFEDTQTYGTPTTWILRRDLSIPGPPFHMNVYESEGRKLRFTANDMSSMLEALLREES